MESKAKLLGHPIHPMLVVFPLGLLVTATIMDVLARLTRRKALAVGAYWNIAGGVIGGAAAAVFGLVDWLAIPWGTRAKSIGLWHATGNLVVIALFTGSWLRRQGRAAELPDDESLTIELTATMIGAVSGWLGGELVDRLGVGVDHGAHLDAPSSLTGPAAPEPPPPPTLHAGTTPSRAAA
jgi:uncharacterized membrane protein